MADTPKTDKQKIQELRAQLKYSENIIKELTESLKSHRLIIDDLKARLQDVEVKERLAWWQR